LQGMVVKTIEYNCTSNDRELDLNLNELKQGMYLLEIIQDNNIVTTNIIKL
jgi:hypothetical protein